MKNFWQKLKKRAELGKPIYALAPMAGITDSAFRLICKSFGADVVYSEMISATAIAYNSKKTFELMKFSEKERPYLVQLFGANPEHFALAAKIIEKKVKPDGLDINFGCPVKKVARQGAGAKLMNDFKLARKIIAATVNSTKLPVSIKCRSREGQVDVLKFLDYMSGLDIKAVMIHGRASAQGQSGEVDWKIIKQARPLVPGILLANGGVKDKTGALELLKRTGADGIGIGQGALGRPWIFEDVKSSRLPIITGVEIDKIPPTLSARASQWQAGPFAKGGKSREEIFKIILKHSRIVEKQKGESGIIEMRKHLCWYVCGLPDAGALRQKLIKVENLNDIKKILE